GNVSRKDRRHAERLSPCRHKRCKANLAARRSPVQGPALKSRQDRGSKRDQGLSPSPPPRRTAGPRPCARILILDFKINYNMYVKNNSAAVEGTGDRPWSIWPQK